MQFVSARLINDVEPMCQRYGQMYRDCGNNQADDKQHHKRHALLRSC